MGYSAALYPNIPIPRKLYLTLGIAQNSCYTPLFSSIFGKRSGFDGFRTNDPFFHLYLWTHFPTVQSTTSYTSHRKEPHVTSNHFPDHHSTHTHNGTIFQQWAFHTVKHFNGLSDRTLDSKSRFFLLAQVSSPK